MKMYSYIGFLLLCLAAPVAFGASTPRIEAKAQLLDHAELLCNNCFFGPSDYYFCFAADNKVLIGYQRTPVLNWRDDTKNYFTRVRKRWIPWASPGDTVPISYDAQHIWVERAGGKPIRLTQSYSLDIFTNNQQCRDAIKAKSH